MSVTHNCKVCGQSFTKTFAVKPNAIGARWLKNWDKCDSCVQKERDELGIVGAEHRAKSHRFRLWEFWEGSGVPKKYLGKTFDDFDLAVGEGKHQKAVQRCRQWAASFSLGDAKASPSIVLWSEGYGTGKTHLASSMLRAVLDASTPDSLGYLSPVHFTTAPEALIRLSASRRWKDSKETEDGVYQHLCAVPLLCLDDVGKEKDRADNAEFYYQVINGRYGNGLPVILTSNVTPQDLAGVIGEAAVSRLQDMAANWWIDMNGPDYRPVEAKARLKGGRP